MTVRTHKTPAFKAQSALDVAERKVTSLDKRLITASLTVTTLTGELTVAKAERDYLASNPALAQALAPVDEAPSEIPAGVGG